MLNRTAAMKLHLLTFFFFGIITAYTVEGVGSEVMRRSFCVSLSSQPLHVNSIKRYTIEEGPMKAVIFVTRKGIKICADPNVKWVRNAIKVVDNRSIKRNVNQIKPTGLQLPTDRTTTMFGKP